VRTPHPLRQQHLDPLTPEPIPRGPEERLDSPVERDDPSRAVHLTTTTPTVRW